MSETKIKLQPWPPQAVEILTKMRSQGCSYSAMAKHLGKTRSMICGKVARLGLPCPAPRVVVKKEQAPPPLVASPMFTDPVPLLQLKSWHCRAINPAPRAKGELASFCGKPVTRRLDGQRSAWCAEHYDLFTDLERMERYGKARERYERLQSYHR